jgi:hypothetical protein
MSRRARENIAAVCFLVVFAGALMLALDFGPRARMIPLPLTILGIALALIQLVWQNLGSTDRLKMDLITVKDKVALDAKRAVQAAEEANTEQVIAGPTWLKVASAYGIVAGLLVLLLAVGPLPAVFVFTFAYFIVTRYYRPIPALMYTAMLTLSIYLVFFVALEIQPYHGLLAPLIEKLH